MDDDLRAELRALQARAYGPGGGLDDDPGARRRLIELETRARDDRRRPPVVDHIPSPESSAPPLHLPPPPPPSVPATVAATARAVPPRAAPTAASPRKRRFLTGVAWAGSLAMVATVAVGITAAASAQRVSAAGAPTTSDAAVTHVATLALDTDRAWPEVLSARPEDGRIFATLAGMTPIVAQYDTGYGDKARCIQILPDEAWSASPEDGWSGAWYTSCAAEPFAPASSVIVSEAAPSGLRERFPDGTRLQFVLGDGVVEVYSAEAPTGEAAD